MEVRPRPRLRAAASPQDVCAAVRSEALEPERTAALSPPSSKRGRLDPSPRWRVLDSLWIHQQAADRRAAISSPGSARRHVVRRRRHRRHPGRRRPDRAPPTPSTSRAPASASPATVGRLRRPRASTAAFRTALGSRLTLGDDDSARADVPFAFPFFYGQRRRRRSSTPTATSRSSEEDSASTERNVARLLTGPPRVSPFLADLDPIAGGARLRQRRRAISTPSPGAPSAASTRRSTVTAQATLLPDGDDRDAIRRRHRRCGDAVVGVSPGRTGDFRTVESERRRGRLRRRRRAVGERFAEQPQLDSSRVDAQVLSDASATTSISWCIWTDAAVDPATRSRSSRRSPTRSAASASTSSTPRATSAAAAGCAASR